MHDIDELALQIGCLYCHAGVGDWCVTTSGAPATHIHADRIYPFRQAFWKGYEQGERDTLALLAHRAARAGHA